MLCQPSLQREYTLCSSFDPALDLPERLAVDPATDTPERVAEAKKIDEERTRRYQVPLDTGRWDEITRDGEKPTMFRFRQIHGPALTWWQAEAARQELSAEESFELAFRLALVQVDNMPRPLELKREKLKLSGRQIDLVTERSIEPLYDIGRDTGEPVLGRLVVLELGAIVATRAMRGAGPLS